MNQLYKEFEGRKVLVELKNEEGFMLVAFYHDFIYGLYGDQQFWKSHDSVVDAVRKAAMV